MVIGAGKVVEWLEKNECTYWRIRSAEKGYVIYKSLDTDNLTVSDSANRLNECLSLMAAGTFFIEAWYSGLATNNYFKTRFTLDSSGNIGSLNQNQYQQPAIDVDAKIRDAIEQYKNSIELERLRTENNELRGQVDTATFRILNRIEPYVGDILGSFFPKQHPVQIAGAKNKHNTEQEMATPQEQERLENAIETWSQTDGDFATLVEKIASLAKSDPATYNMAKNMLMNR